MPNDDPPNPDDPNLVNLTVMQWLTGLPPRAHPEAIQHVWLGQDRQGNSWLIRWSPEHSNWIGLTLVQDDDGHIDFEAQGGNKLSATIIRSWGCPEHPTPAELAAIEIKLIEEERNGSQT